MRNNEICRSLKLLRADFARENGRSFEHFYCPLMMTAEDVELCMGHVLPQALPNSTRLRVVQRKDIDNFYGRVAEADFNTLVSARSKGLKGIMHDPALMRRLRPQMIIDGKEVKYYPFQGSKREDHARIDLETDEVGRAIKLVVAMNPADVMDAQAKQWGIGFEFDCRVAMMVTVIKAAYLTLFRMHGYRWALSAGGIEIGYQLLGGFFRKYRTSEPNALKEALQEHFRPYRHMVRPVAGFVGDNPPRGTLEDNRCGICFGSSGKPFGQIVYVRIDEACFGILMPGYENADSAAAYHAFLTNDNETLRISSARFNEEKDQWEVRPEPMVTHWPKQDESFEFD